MLQPRKTTSTDPDILIDDHKDKVDVSFRHLQISFRFVEYKFRFVSYRRMQKTGKCSPTVDWTPSNHGDYNNRCSLLHPTKEVVVGFFIRLLSYAAYRPKLSHSAHRVINAQVKTSYLPFGWNLLQPRRLKPPWLHPPFLTSLLQARTLLWCRVLAAANLRLFT